MRRLIATTLAAVILGGLMALVPGLLTAAWADCPPDPVNDKGICLSDTVPEPPPPEPPPPGTDPDPIVGSTCPGAPGGRCTDAAGNYWNSAHDCYASVQDPQPAPNDPVWSQNNVTPADGQFWWCLTGPNQTAIWFAENGEEPQLVDAAAIAQQLVARAPFEVADLEMAPPYDFHTYIHIENWFWVPEGQWYDVSVSEDVGPASVTLTATPTRLEVETGDGAPATSCYDAGRPWVKGMSDTAETTCSYAYPSIEDPVGSIYTVVGRLHYDVAWTCSGLCAAPAGDLGEYPAPQSESHQVDVRQRQTVVTH